jgi:16S rRNA (guanine527-N7)-methyltransferase
MRFPAPDIETIEASAKELGLSIDGTPIKKWLDTLVEWNARMDLTAARSSDELLDLMLADAAILAARTPQGASVVDVGTGAGAPGLAMALLRPDLKVTLVEPLVKRVSFLRSIGARVKIERTRGEAVKGRFDVAVSRATLAPAQWLELGSKLADRVWVLLAREEPPAGAIEEDVSYTWPRTGAQRRAVRYSTTTV